MHLELVARGARHLLVKRWAGPFWYRRRWLDGTQWLSAPELKAIQLRLLQKLVMHCYKTVPFYTEMMNKAGIRPEDIRELDDIKRFPIINKKDVLTAGDAIISKGCCRKLMSKGTTSGTTGTPLVLRRNYLSLGNEHAFLRRLWDWASLGFGDRAACLTSRVVADPRETQGRLWTYEPFMKELILSTFHLSTETGKRYLEAMRLYKVSTLVGYASACAFLARTVLDSGIDIRLKAVLPMSETLSDEARRLISEAFQCKVFSHYGAAERVCYIFTCEHGRYHVQPEYGYTELLPTGGNDPDECAVVATGFWNHAMPLIRYDTSDTVVRSDESCECGRAFPVVKSISGRKGDVLRTRSGIEYMPTLMAALVKKANNVLESQVIQDTIDHVCVLYVPGEKFSEQDLAKFRHDLTMHLSSELRLDFRQVKAIERTNAGKANLIVSRLQGDAAEGGGSNA